MTAYRMPKSTIGIEAASFHPVPAFYWVEPSNLTVPIFTFHPLHRKNKTTVSAPKSLIINHKFDFAEPSKKETHGVGKFKSKKQFQECTHKPLSIKSNQ